MFTQRGNFLSGGAGIPELDGAVMTAGSQELLGCGITQGADRASVARKSRAERSAIGIPKLDGFVVAPGGQKLAVVKEHQCGGRTLVLAEGRNFFAPAIVPDANGAVATGR